MKLRWINIKYYVLYWYYSILWDTKGWLSSYCHKLRWRLTSLSNKKYKLELKKEKNKK